MKRVLIVTYWYPPNQSIASLRVSKFAKYLPSFDWEPVIVTVQPGSDLYLRAGRLPDEIRAGRVYRTKDHALGVWIYNLVGRFHRQARASSKASRSFSFYGSRNVLVRLAYGVYRQCLCFPDECWPWLFEYPEVRRVLLRERPDVILSSSGPATTHLMAHQLASEFGLPWVADFRDPWSRNQTIRRVYPLNLIETYLEKCTLQPARALTTVSEAWCKQLSLLHQKPAYLVTNGFDEEDSVRGAGHHSGEALSASVFSIVYTGTIYAGYQDPSPIFRGLTALLRQGKVGEHEVQIKFYGRNLNAVSRVAQDYPDLRGVVHALGEISHAQSLYEQRSATALLFLEWQDLKEQGMLTGKIYEYLAARRPILVCGPRGGAVEPLLKETGAGVVVTNSEEAQIVLERWIKEFHQTGRLSPTVSPEALKPYSRRYQTGKLAEVLDGVSGQS